MAHRTVSEAARTERDENIRICWAVDQHISEATPIDGYGDFYSKVSETLRNDYGLNITPNQVRRRYGTLRKTRNVDEIDHIKKMLKAKGDAEEAEEADREEREAQSAPRYATGVYPPAPTWDDILKK